MPSALFIASTIPLAHPSLPKVMINARPAITGDIEKGISISVAKNCLPLNENLVRSHDATIPNTVLTISAIIVAIIVTLSADNT